MINWGSKNNPLYLAYQRIQEERRTCEILSHQERLHDLKLIDQGLVIAANIIKDIQEREWVPERFYEIKKYDPSGRSYRVYIKKPTRPIWSEL
jgi:hypothetical protein